MQVVEEEWMLAQQEQGVGVGQLVPELEPLWCLDCL